MRARALAKLPGKIGLGDIRLTSVITETGVLETKLGNILAKGGVNVVDTAAVYDFGQAEIAVGNALKSFRAEDFFLISKFGYHTSTGDNTGDPLHSCESDFMQESLETSMKRLGRLSIDAYLLHEPEAQLIEAFPLPSVVENSDDSGQVAPPCEPEERDAFLRDKLTKTVQDLEEQVSLGRISSYGISSNTVGLPASHPHHVSLDLIASLAASAAKERGLDRHSMNILQLPFNVIDTKGLQVAKKAEQTYGMHVMAMRPLTVVDETALWRLEGLTDTRYRESWSKIDEVVVLDKVFEDTLSYFVAPPPENPDEPTTEELETVEAVALMTSLLRDLKSEFPKIVSEDHYELNLQGSIIPLIHGRFDGMDETTIEVLQTFFDAYGTAVRAVAPYHARKYIESVLDPFDVGDDGIQRVHQVPDGVKLEEYALQWMMKKDSPIGTIMLDVNSMGNLE